MGVDLYWLEEDLAKRGSSIECEELKTNLQEAVDKTLTCQKKLDEIKRIIEEDENFKIMKIKKVLNIE